MLTFPPQKTGLCLLTLTKKKRKKEKKSLFCTNLREVSRLLKDCFAHLYPWRKILSILAPATEQTIKIKGNLSDKMDLVENWRISAISNTLGELHSREKGISDLQFTYTCLLSCCDFILMILWNSVLLTSPWRDHLTQIKPASPPKNSLYVGTDAFALLMK